jgi:hypothetical protein
MGFISFNGAFVSDGKIIQELWLIGKDLEGIGRGLVEVMSRHLTVGTEEDHEYSHQW